jgi:hypothetical protein
VHLPTVYTSQVLASIHAYYYQKVQGNAYAYYVTYILEVLGYFMCRLIVLLNITGVGLILQSSFDGLSLNMPHSIYMYK